MFDLVEIFQHWLAGDSLRHIARNLGVARDTVIKLVKTAERKGLHRGQPWDPEFLEAFVREHFSEAVGSDGRSREFSKLEEHHEAIVEGLKENHASTVWQRLRDEQHLRVSRSTFYRYVQQRLPRPVRAADVVVHRPKGVPGDEVQVDFGRLGFWTDPATGKRYNVQAFAMTLVWSRHMFVCPVAKLNSANWLSCHVKAFEFFGAVPRRVVLDNLKDGVVKADLYDPKINRSYREMANHYGILLDPCRSSEPTDKPHVERVVPYVRDSYWKGRSFGSWEEMEREALRWCREVAGMRIHRTTQLRPLEFYEAEEKPAMLPLPSEPWEQREWLTAKVAPDSHCLVKRTLYSVPWRLLGRTLDVCVTRNTVQFSDGQDVVKTHLRADGGGRRTDNADLPPDRIAFFQRTPQWCLRTASSLGPAVEKAVSELLQENTLLRLRQVQGIIRLGEKYGADRLDAACARALGFGDPSLRTVRNILQAGLERQPSLFDWSPSTPAGAFLRGPEAFTGGASDAEGGPER